MLKTGQKSASVAIEKLYKDFQERILFEQA